ncbi:MAG: hypothetical protein EPO08_01590 [Rhodospirillaceae bacterium]|nr:MAG: hypothetical protein EPO08_01590 [Rhodospirillaceae bacterium]
MATFFSDHFDVNPVVLEKYGAFDVSLLTDLPLFIDPFLLFNSKQSKYRQLHDDIIQYLVFLKGKALAGQVDEHLLRAWYCFPEVRQTWLGFTEGGNDGRGLGMDFAKALHGSLHDLFPDFGEEQVTQGSHLEKVCLIKDGVGRDNISDFTTNLIKGYLYGYTEDFAKTHLREQQCRRISIRNVVFNYDTETWEAREFVLPWVNGDHVVLTPKDILTRDENWINRVDLLREFEEIPLAIPDQQLRAQVNNYFYKALTVRKDREPTQKEQMAAAAQTIREFPQVIDYYIRSKENNGGKATNISAARVRFSEAIFNAQIRELQAILSTGTFYKIPTNTYEEAHARIEYLKNVIENQDGYRAFYKDGKPLHREKDLQIMFRLVWFGTPSDVTSEANDGRGPADFKVSRGAADKTIIELKLAKNTALKKNLQHQTPIYQKASSARSAIKVVMFFTPEERARVFKILDDLALRDSRDIVLIDARTDNKPSGSKARAA